MNKIIFELCTEDRARLDKIIAALEKKAAVDIWPKDLGAEAIPTPAAEEEGLGLHGLRPCLRG